MVTRSFTKQDVRAPLALFSMAGRFCRSVNLLKTIVALFVMGLPIGCGHVPKEAVDLSAAVGKGMAGQQAAYLNLFNAYFALKRDKIDAWIRETYIPLFMAEVRKGMAAAGKTAIDDEGMREILLVVMEKRDSMQSDLEKTRIALWEQVTRDQVLLMNSNAHITGLLQSLVDTQAATQTLVQTADRATGKQFNFSNFETVFDDYLKKAGDLSRKGTSLVERMKPLIEGGR